MFVNPLNPSFSRDDFSPSTSLLHLSILRTCSKQFLNEPDPLSLCTHESVASGFALLHLLKPLFMGFERLMQLVYCLWCSQHGELFEFFIAQAFWIKN